MNSESSERAAARVVITVKLDEPEASLERLEQLTAVVREELLGIDVEAVSPTRVVPAPVGARAPDATAVGELVVVLGSSAALLREVVRVLTAWRERHRPRSVELHVGDLSLRLDEASEEQQALLVEAFIRNMRRR